LKIKTTREEVQYSQSQSAVNCSSWNGHSDWEPARRLVDDSWAAVIKDGRDAYGNRRQRRWSSADRRLLCINTPASGSRWQRTARWLASQHLVDGRSCQKEKDYEVVTALAASFARLQSLHLVALKV